MKRFSFLLIYILYQLIKLCLMLGCYLLQKRIVQFGLAGLVLINVPAILGAVAVGFGVTYILRKMNLVSNPQFPHLREGR